MTLEQSLNGLLAKHCLNHFTICTTHDGRFCVFAQWGEGEARDGVMSNSVATIADALTDAITKANAKRAIAPNVILPGAPLLVEVENTTPKNLRIARVAVAQVWKEAGYGVAAKSYRDGKRDDCTEIRAILKALEMMK